VQRVNATERPRVVIASAVSPAVVEHLADRFEVVNVFGAPRSTVLAAVATAAGILINSAIRIDTELIAAAPQLRIVATASVGYDNIDLEALAQRGILLSNTRGSLVETVADLAFGLVIATMRRLGPALAWVRTGNWTSKPAPFGHDLEAATLGIVGLGAIGAALARRAQVSGMRVIYSNRRPRRDDAVTGASYRTFEALLGEADCVVVLVPLTSETRGMFGDAAFSRMKPNATLVNVARGAVVDTNALLRALNAGRIAGAALDVTDPQPIPADHPLAARDDVLITPHMGSATYETRERMAFVAAENLLAWLDGKPLPTQVELESAAR
jgi:glyoxylate reductase